LADKDLNISLVIMDIGSDANTGFGILSKLKEKKADIPVIILTSNSKRVTFARGIAEGASDYILKPFDDTYLLNKLLHIIDKKKHKNELGTNSELVFELQCYLNTEFKKALKGNYNITVLMCTFFLPVDEYTIDIENKYIHASDLFYHKFKSNLWDTDIFERYGSQVFVGIFPFCGLDNVDKVKKKIMNSFEEVKLEHTELDAYHLAISSITYPSESNDAKALLYLLGLRMKKRIDELKRML
jgi:PleD family two-component response regulator